MEPEDLRAQDAIVRLRERIRTLGDDSLDLAKQPAIHESQMVCRGVQDLEVALMGDGGKGKVAAAHRRCRSRHRPEFCHPPE